MTDDTPEPEAEEAARTLDKARRARVATPRLTRDRPELDETRAYRIQDAGLACRLADGERITGVKLGLTSEAKQRQMGVDRPLTAWLTDAMVVRPGATAPRESLIHPRIEPEIVFVLGERLEGPGITPAQALRAVAWVCAGLEIIDSRYENFDFTLPDVIADNASAAAYLVGERRVPPADIDAIAEGCFLRVDGRRVAAATGAAVLGDPARALAFAADSLAARGLALEPGWLVLTGGLTDAVPLAPEGTVVEAEFSTLGTLSVRA